MSSRAPDPARDPLDMFRDPYDGEPSLDDEFEFEVKAVDAKPMPPAEHEEQLRAQATPYVGRPVCGARTRRGSICLCKKLYKGGRCKFHGGLSTGPKTAEGKSRAALNLPNARRVQLGPVNLTPEEEASVES